jgi:hypothetical protein
MRCRDEIEVLICSGRVVRSNSEKEEQGLLSQIEEGMPMKVRIYARVAILVRLSKNFNNVQLDLQRKVEKTERIYWVIIVPFELYIIGW